MNNVQRKKVVSRNMPRKTSSGVIRRVDDDEAVRFVGRRIYDGNIDSPAQGATEEASRWLRIVKPKLADAPGIGICKSASGNAYQASFSLQLTTVSSRSIAESIRRGREEFHLSRNELVRQQAMNAMISSLAPQDALTISYEVTRDEHRSATLKIYVTGKTEGPDIDTCTTQCLALFDNLCITMAASGAEFGFQELAEPVETPRHAAANTLRLMPASVQVPSDGARPVGFDRDRSIAQVRLPLPATTPQSFLSASASAMLAVSNPLSIRIRMTRALIDSAQLELIRGAAQQLADGNPYSVILIGASDSPGVLGPKTLDATRHALESWFAQPDGMQLDVELSSAVPIPEALIRVLGGEILQGRPFHALLTSHARTSPETIELSSLILRTSPFPPILPEPSSLDTLGFARHFPVMHFAVPTTGITLGEIPMQFADTPVRFAADDRSQHCYVIGATGTGKSTLLSSMIEQDISNGSGVALVDPHGDLFEQVLSTIPARRRDDVVLLDFTDKSHFVGLNFLQRPDKNNPFEKNFIIHELAEIFTRLYGNVPESMGPAFQQYMRNAVALVMEDPGGDLTLLDVPTVFSDQGFREYLLAHCKDEMVSDFWRGIAGRATGDASIANFGPYITNKFTEFTQNALVRMVVGQSHSTIDFRKIIDQRKILLVNVSKGLLSETDSKFLGMIVTGRLFGAALSRANVKRTRRTPFFVYLDEFQNFTTGSIAQTLAEARKYGLALTLAHQNLAQLPDALGEAVLANAGSQILMRVGSPDAHKLERFVSPHFSEHDLASLPDHHAIARLKVKNVPSPAFVLRTILQKEGSSDSGNRVMVQNIIDKSRNNYCRSADVIQKEITWRRHRHLLRTTPAAHIADDATRHYLKERNVRTMADLGQWDSEMIKQLLAQKLGALDRSIFERVLKALRLQGELKSDGSA